MRYLNKFIRGLVHPLSWCLDAIFYRRTLTRKSDVNSITLIKIDNIGDFVIALPYILLVRDVFPCADWKCIVSPQIKSIAELFFNDVQVYEGGALVATNSHQTANAATNMALHKAMRCDLLVDLRSDVRTVFLGCTSNARWRVSLGRLRTLQLIDRIFLNSKNVLSERELYRDTFAKFGFDTGPLNLKRVVSKYSPKFKGQFDSELCAEPKQRTIIFHVGASRDYKCWPVQNFLEVAKSLCASGDFKAIFVGSADERHLVRALDLKSFGVDDYVGKTSMCELFALVSSCDFFIGNDSAVGHIAAMYDKPSITIYGGPSDPRRFAPNGWGEHKNIIIQGTCRCHNSDIDQCQNLPNWCMAEVTSSHVVSTFRQMQQSLKIS